MSEESGNRPEWLSDKYQTVEDQAKAWNEVQGLIGRKGVLPGPDAPPEEWGKAMSNLIGSAPDEFRNAHTVPTEAKDYGLQAPEGMEKDLETFTAEMADLGVSKGIAAKAWEKQLEAAKARAEAAAAEVEAKKTALADKFGNAVERMKAESNAALDAYGTDELREFLTEHGENPVMLEFLAKIGQTLGEDRVNYQSAHRGTLTPAELEEQIVEAQAATMEWATKAVRGNLSDLEMQQARAADEKLRKLLLQRPGGKDVVGVLNVASR